MMIRLTLLSALALALTASVAVAQTTPDARHPADAAKAFSLDLPAAAPVDPALSSQAPGANNTPATVSFTLDTPIGQLLADPRAKAVLDEDMPGLSDDSNLSKFELMSLRQFQPMTGGQMSNALLAKTGTDLAAIGSQANPVAAALPVRRQPAATKNMDSGR